MNDKTRAEAIAKHTQAIQATGRTVLQLFQVGDDEREHCEHLLELMQPPTGAVILDVGCGVGGVARYMKAVRPDLNFILLNDNEYQLTQCMDFPSILCDMHRTRLPSNMFEVVMVCHTLGYADLDRAFDEWARILKPDGQLFIVDMTGDNPMLAQTLGYKTYTSLQISRAAEEHGMALMGFAHLDADLERFQEVIDMDPGSADLVRESVKGMTPIVWKIRK